MSTWQTTYASMWNSFKHIYTQGKLCTWIQSCLSLSRKEESSVLSPQTENIPINSKSKVDETGSYPKLQHFRQMKPKIDAKMNTTLLVFWCSASSFKSFHYYFSISKSKDYYCYNQVKRTCSHIQWYLLLVMWFHWYDSVPQNMLLSI